MSDMSPIDIRLKGLAMREYPGDSYPVEGVTPHRHQWALYDALTSGVPGVFVNDAPTGAGKTLSWLAPTISQGLDTVAVYPTNALIEDQKGNIDSLLEDIDGGDSIHLLAVSSETLQKEYANKYPAADSNGERLSYLLRDAFRRPETVILLTNPDIFVLLRREIYHKRIDGINLFEVAVVDEFHRASRKEQNTLLFLLDEMYEADTEICRLSYLVFLSATPDEDLTEWFDKAVSGSYYPLTEFGWRETPHPALIEDDQPVITFAPGELPTASRPVLPPLELRLQPAATFQTATQLAEQRETSIDRLARGRTVVMLDGIHEVDRIYRLLQESNLGAVERIDGFHRGDIAEKLNRFDTLVSNAAVEVGVDFDTDQVLFSAHSAATFFQRLGRLRTREDTSNAYAYIPPYVQKALQQVVDDFADQWIDRDRFKELIGERYIDNSTPKSFDWRYSTVEAYHHIEQRVEKAPPDERSSLREEGWKRIERHFCRPHGTVFSKEDVRRCHDAVQTKILDKLQMYRGETLQLSVYDSDQEIVQNYNMGYLLRHGKIRVLDRDTFFSHIPPRLEDDALQAERYSVGYCVYYGSYENDDVESDEEYSGRELCFKPTGELYTLLTEGQRQSREPKVCTGLEVETLPNIDGLDYLKLALSETEVLCYPIEGHVKEISKQYSIGEFGFIYPLLNPEGDTAAITFSHDALYLYCRVQDQQEADGLDIEVNDL
jgi:CRISPR-associated endonuclease/helicase Cas3